MKNTLLLIIDPQNDFVDSKGSLFVPGAPEAVKNIAEFIKGHGNELNGIAVTMDTHHRFHIAHPKFWTPEPKPFTKITSKDIEDRKYVPANETYYETGWGYVKSIGELTIWPEHCLIGTSGWAIPEVLTEAIHSWEIQKDPIEFAEYYQKGENPFFEAFSLFTSAPGYEDYRPYADIDIFSEYDEIIVCGFAKDVCVANTVMDMLRYGEEYYKNKLVFYEPGMASIDPNSEMNKIFQDAVEQFGARVM